MEIKKKPWFKAIAVFLTALTVFSSSTITCFAMGAGVPEKVEMQGILSDYIEEIVDTENVKSVDTQNTQDNDLYLNMKDGSTTVYSFSEPVIYTDENGNIKCKDISIIEETDEEMLALGYDFCNAQNDYKINLSSNSQRGALVQYGDISFSFAPISDISAPGYISKGTISFEEFEDFEYADVYGNGTILKYFPQINGIKEEITIDSPISRSSFGFILRTKNCSPVINQNGSVSLVSQNGEEVQNFAAPFAYDSQYIEGISDEHYCSDCYFEINKISSNTYELTVNVSAEWLESNSTSYPVTIDPTTSNISNSMDLPIHSGRTTSGTQEDNNAVGTSSQYGTSRTLIFIKYPTEITQTATINSAYYWTRELTGRTSDMNVGIYRVTSHWNNSYTWAQRPDWDPTRLDMRNVNTTSPDTANHLWYKFNITNGVQAQYNAGDNKGFMMKSEDEDGAYNLRTFAQLEYSVSSMRPYTVINYTNDTTAPTVQSVTGNPSSWTNNNVTLTVNGAVDNEGGSGLHAAPYSFSTSKDTYSWQSSNFKTFSSNCTVYVYVRDALNNIRLVSTQIINKIDKATPTVTSVNKSTEDWTNEDVTIEVTGAKDSQSGLNSSAYSFSTTNGSYSWQTDNSKKFSENQTVYVYVRDEVSNISLASTVEINNIDKTKPSAPTVTGNTDNWTNCDIELTAQSTDDESGVAQYSFSTSKDQYNWQTENTYTASENSKIYVYSKDNAGNISEPTEIDLQIDKLTPTGIVIIENPTTWVNQVTITADASDEISGLHEMPYSFSTNEGEYNWQAENTKTITRNGTYYVYARDLAENITLLDTITIDKIDSTAPSITNINLTDNNDKTIIIITAEDSESGVFEYSIDDGTTWQRSNTFEIEKDSLNYIAVKVKDNVDNQNTFATYYDIYTPQLYYEDGKVGIYNPNPNCACDIYYKLGNAPKYVNGKIVTYKWIKYEKPFIIDENQENIYLSFYTRPYYQVPNATPVEIEYNNIFEYSEQDTDLSLVYKGVSLNISRQYKSGEWNYSIDSCLNIKSNSLIQATLPNFNSLNFVKQNKYLYINECSSYKLVAVYDENDENIIEYILKYGKINYHYNVYGKLIRVSNSGGDLFNLIYSENSIIILDGAGRETVVNYTNNHITSITDANGGIINYIYADGNLIKVVDQANVIIGEYEYAENVLVKSGYNNIVRDDENRISEIRADNGYLTQYEYSDNTVTVTTSDEKSVYFSYNFRGNILTSTDEYGNETVYTYDNENRLIKTVCGNTTTNRLYYNNNGELVEKSNETGTILYYYNEDGNLVRIYDSFYSSQDEATSTYYVYDEFDNIIIQAKLDNLSNTDYPEEYSPDYNYEYVNQYEYSNGLLVKTTDDNGNTTVNTYDEYGNNIKTTSTIIQDDETIISISQSTYDILNRLTFSKSDNSEISYLYDAAGRTLLTNADGSYQRTVYDNYGRVIQEITNSDYNPELDNLPNAYTDTSVGCRYIYDNDGNLVKEINELNIETDYVYSSVGTLYKKSFDIYDYYYQNNGSCDKIDINGRTIVDYDYKVTNSEISVADGQYINQTTYANGYTENYVVDNNGNVFKKYADNNIYYSISSASEQIIIYNDNEIYQKNKISLADNSYSYIKQTNTSQNIFSYTVASDDNTQTITENHFGGEEYKTVVSENSTDYISPDYSFTYNVESNDDSSISNISSDSTVVLSSNINYNETENVLSKSYCINNREFSIIYDDEGNIISDGNNQYSYNEYGELISSNGLVNSAYTYDSRGNMLSKTVNGETTNFAYSNEQWQDQLTSVNGTLLEYDANGNLSSYGNTQYTWSHGIWLNSITSGDNIYSYKYDSNGIRASKTVNGVTTKFNTLDGKILAQYNNTDNIYFQYNNNTPIGFVLNDVQYFYITNLSGDIVGITDSSGNLIAEYSYDEWGKLLSITPAEENNAEQLSIAQTNPLRYRGYYYDNESGLYYLQSRYYSPDLCRFISADCFDYLNTSAELNMNAYIYCWNCPVVFDDIEGTTPKLSINLSDIISFIQNIKGGTNAEIRELTEKWNNLVDNWKNALKIRYNTFIDKLEYFINYPDAVINNALSTVFNKDVNIRFRLIEFIREQTNLSIDLSGLKVDADIKKNNEIFYSAKSRSSASSSDENNITMAIFQGIVAAIELDWINDVLEFFGSSLEKLFKNVSSFTVEITSILLTTFNVVWEYIPNYIRVGAAAGAATTFTLDKMFEFYAKDNGVKKDVGVVRAFGAIFALIGFSIDMNSAGEGKIFTKTEDTIMNVVGLVIDLFSLFLGPVGCILVPIASDIVMDITALRIKGFIFMC